MLGAKKADGAWGLSNEGRRGNKRDGAGEGTDGQRDEPQVGEVQGG